MLSRRAGLSAIAGLSCYCSPWITDGKQFGNSGIGNFTGPVSSVMPNQRVIR